MACRTGRYLQVNVSDEFGTRKGTRFGYRLEIAAFTATDASTWLADAKKLVKWPTNNDESENDNNTERREANPRGPATTHVAS